MPYILRVSHYIPGCHTTFQKQTYRNCKGIYKRRSLGKESNCKLQQMYKPIGVSILYRLKYKMNHLQVNLEMYKQICHSGMLEKEASTKADKMAAGILSQGNYCFDTCSLRSLLSSSASPAPTSAVRSVDHVRSSSPV